MEYFIFIGVMFLIVLTIEIACARQKVTCGANDPNTVNPRTTAITNKCPNCTEEIDTNTAVCKHCGSFVCYFWYKP